MKGSRGIRLAPAVVLIALLAVLTLRAWNDVGDEPLQLSDPASGLTGITWSAGVSPAGRLAVSIRYDFADDALRTLRAFVPDRSRYLRIDGKPVDASNGTDGSADVSSVATVTYELPGAVTRYRDGAILRLATVRDTSIDGDQGLFPCALCYIDPVGYGNAAVFGALAVPGARSVHLEFIGLSSVRAAADDTQIRFVGIDRSADDVSMLAVLPAGAVPDLVVRDGTVAQALRAAHTDLAAAGRPFHSPHAPAHGETWAAVVITILLAAIVGWVVVRLWIARRSASTAGRGPDSDPATGINTFADTRSVAPSDLEPALASAVTNDSPAGVHSAVAATIVELARRNVIQFDGTDARRFSIVIPADAAGGTTFEQSVIDSLRGEDPASEAVTRTSAHLWGNAPDAVTKHLRVALLRAARHEHLLRISAPAVLLVPLTIAMAVIAGVATRSGLAFPIIVAVLGSLLAVATVSSALVVLTARGRLERVRWSRYGAYLRSSDDQQYLGAAEPWDVAEVGPLLADATALGRAGEVVRCLSPDRKHTT